MAGSLAMRAVLAIGATPIIQLIAGHDYIAAAPTFRWYLLGMVLIIANAPTQRALVALGRPASLLGFEIGVLVILVVAATIGALYFGLVGIAVAIVIQRVVQWLSTLWFVNRVIRVMSAEASPSSAESPLPAA